VANSGHFNVEINIGALEDLAVSHKSVRNMVEQYEMRDGRKINLIAEGRLVNLAAAEGHPSAVMDMSFANQATSAEYMVKHHKEMAVGVYDVPKELDEEVAAIKLAAMGVSADTLTPEQAKYLASWESGT
jgi:adenosylhomocysteinase